MSDQNESSKKPLVIGVIGVAVLAIVLYLSGVLTPKEAPKPEETKAE